jgi:hypothetical protein
MNLAKLGTLTTVKPETKSETKLEFGTVTVEFARKMPRKWENGNGVTYSVLGRIVGINAAVINGKAVGEKVAKLLVDQDISIRFSSDVDEAIETELDEIKSNRIICEFPLLGEVRAGTVQVKANGIPQYTGEGDPVMGIRYNAEVDAPASSREGSILNAVTLPDSEEDLIAFLTASQVKAKANRQRSLSAWSNRTSIDI